MGYTFRDKGGVTYIDTAFVQEADFGEEKVIKGEAIERLAEYEEMEEKGQLIRLPCPEGTEVYYIFGAPLLPAEQCCINRTFFEIKDRDRIGVDMWLTKQEAHEAKIQQYLMERNCNWTVDHLREEYRKCLIGVSTINQTVMKCIDDLYDDFESLEELEGE